MARQRKVALEPRVVRSYDIRRGAPSRSRRRPLQRLLRARGSTGLAAARRALALLAREGAAPGEYVVTDARTVPGAGGRRVRIVYLQQRFMGLPVYDGRRSVVFSGRVVRKTGARIPVRSLPTMAPVKTAEAAVRAAIGRVYRGRCPQLEPVCRFASPEQFVAFRGDGLSIATAHLAVFVARTARLAWVVDLATVTGPRFEVVLDATSLERLLVRPLSQQADACIALRPGEAPVRMPYDLAWEGSGAIDVSFKNAAWQPLPAVNGVISGGTVTRDVHSINAFTLANHAVDLFARLLPVLRPLHASVLLFTELVKQEAAAAFADDRGVILKGLDVGSGRYAVRDPSVVLHEVSHVVLNAAVGGSTLAHPFESTGESAAVSEGLSDFLGLTIWNSICRSSASGRPQEEAFASYLLKPGRDYKAYFEGDGPTRRAETEAHEAGMALCGALLQARAHLIDDAGLTDDEADERLWTAVCRGLPHLPHQGDLPQFCCVRRVVADHVPAAFQAIVEEAFQDISIPACPHFDEGGHA